MAKSSKHPFDAKRNDELRTIGLIADRAVLNFAKANIRVDRTDILLDVLCCHRHAQPLRLTDLLAADDLNFNHDIGGINRFLDRENYRLNDGFSPRFSVRRAS